MTVQRPPARDGVRAVVWCRMPNFSHLLTPALFAFELDRTGHNPVERLRLFQKGLTDSNIRRILAGGPAHPDAIPGVEMESPWWLAAQADTLTAPHAVASLLSHLATDLFSVAGLVLPRLSPSARPIVVTWARQHPTFLRGLLLSTDRDTRAWAICLAGEMDVSDASPPLQSRPSGGRIFQRVWRTVQGLPPIGEDLRAKWLRHPTDDPTAGTAEAQARPRRVTASR